MYHVLEAANPGTVETSIIATDNNNNPNIINSIYNVAARLASRDRGDDGRARPIDHAAGRQTRGASRMSWSMAPTRSEWPGALDRVFVNIGMFGEEWVRCHNPIFGVRTQKPFSIPYARKHSVYWRATEERTPNLADYLIRASGPMPLRDAPGGAELSDNRREDSQSRPHRFRRELHAVPFEQAA